MDKVLHIRVPGSLYEQVQAYADSHGEDTSHAIRVLLRRGLDDSAVATVVERAVAAAVPVAVEALTSAQILESRRAMVAATVAVVGRVQGLPAEQQRALLESLLGTA